MYLDFPSQDVTTPAVSATAVVATTEDTDLQIDDSSEIEQDIEVDDETEGSLYK